MKYKASLPFIVIMNLNSFCRGPKWKNRTPNSGQMECQLISDPNLFINDWITLLLIRSFKR